MVGGFRCIRPSGFDSRAEELAEARRREERIAEYHSKMARGMIQFAEEALTRGDVFEYATLSFGALAQINPALRTPESYEATIRYLTGLPLNQDTILPSSSSQPNSFNRLSNYLGNVFRRSKTQLNKPEETA